MTSQVTQICNLSGSQETIRQENLTSCPPATAHYMFAMHSYEFHCTAQDKETSCCDPPRAPFNNAPVWSGLPQRPHQERSGRRLGSSLCLQALLWGCCINTTGIQHVTMLIFSTYQLQWLCMGSVSSSTGNLLAREILFGLSPPALGFCFPTRCYSYYNNKLTHFCFYLSSWQLSQCVH